VNYLTNIALLTELSEIAIVDVDDAGLVSQMQLRFGPTPLIVRTPGRDGRHLYYRQGEGVGLIDLRGIEAIPVEVKAGKNIVVVPPSVHPLTDRRYECIEGAFDRTTIQALPPFHIEGLGMGRSPGDVRRVLKGRGTGGYLASA
jgi:hypothetical protein